MAVRWTGQGAMCGVAVRAAMGVRGDGGKEERALAREECSGREWVM